MQVSIEKEDNPRVFDYHLDFPFLSVKKENKFFLPPAKVIYSEEPESSISNIIVYSRIPDPPYIERLAEVKDNTIVVGVSGTCKNDDRTQATASFGIWFRDSSLYNANGQLPTDVPQTFQAAELYAVKMALKTLRDKIFTSAQHKGINQVFVLTESKYIKESLSKDIWKWESNNYVTARKTPVANSDALKEVHELIKGFEAKGTAVLFWVVERKYNKDAAGLAREALGVEEDEVQEAKKKSKKKKPKNKPDSDSEMGREKKPDKGKGKEKDEDAPDCDYIPGFNPLELYTGNMNHFGGYGLSRDNINNFTASTAKLYRGPDNHF